MYCCITEWDKRGPLKIWHIQQAGLQGLQYSTTGTGTEVQSRHIQQAGLQGLQYSITGTCMHRSTV
jgi:hypothetical protein